MTGVSAQTDHILESGGCRCKYADCRFPSNGQLTQLSHMYLNWTCGRDFAKYELGLATGKVFWSLYDLSNESFLTRC